MKLFGRGGSGGGGSKGSLKSLLIKIGLLYLGIYFAGGALGADLSPKNILAFVHTLFGSDASPAPSTVTEAGVSTLGSAASTATTVISIGDQFIASLGAGGIVSKVLLIIVVGAFIGVTLPRIKGAAHTAGGAFEDFFGDVKTRLGFWILVVIVVGGLLVSVFRSGNVYGTLGSAAATLIVLVVNVLSIHLISNVLQIPWDKRIKDIIDSVATILMKFVAPLSVLFAWVLPDTGISSYQSILPNGAGIFNSILSWILGVLNVIASFSKLILGALQAAPSVGTYTNEVIAGAVIALVICYQTFGLRALFDKWGGGDG